MTTVTLTANTSQVTTALNQVNDGIKQVNTSQQKLNETTTSNAQKTTDALAAQKVGLVGVIEKMTQFITLQKSGETFDATKGLQAQWNAITSAITGGLGVLTMFKEEIMKFETLDTEKTALRLMSKDGEDLNKVLSRTREITLGVAKGSEILETVNKLLLKGFNLTEQSLEKLIDVSGIYSSITGQDMNSIMLQLAQASQRERDALFEKMGVYIKHDEVLGEYAKKMGTTIEKLDEATKSNVLLSEGVGQLKTHFDSLGLSAESLESKTTHAFKVAEDRYNAFKKSVIGTGLDLFNAAIDKVETFLIIINKDWDIYDSKKAEKVVADYTEQWNKIILTKEQAMIAVANSNLRTDTMNEEQNKINAEKNKQAMETFAQTMETLESQKNVLYDKITEARKTMNTREMNELGVTVNNSWITFKNIWDDVLGKSAVYVKQKNDETKKELWNTFDLKQQMDSMDRQASDDVAKKTVKKTPKVEAKKDEIAELWALMDEEKKQKADLLKKENDEIIKGIKYKTDILKSGFEIERDLAKQQQEHRQKIQDEDNKINEINRKEREKQIKKEQEIEKKAQEYVVEASNFAYQNLIAGKTNFLKEMIALSMQKAGAEIFNDGLQGMWQGGRWALSPYPTMAAQGVTMMGYSALEMGAGVALGYAGSKLMPSTGSSSESKSKETAAQDRKANQSNNTQKMDMYMYPDEKAWLRALNKGTNKLKSRGK